MCQRGQRESQSHDKNSVRASKNLKKKTKTKDGLSAGLALCGGCRFRRLKKLVRVMAHFRLLADAQARRAPCNRGKDGTVRTPSPVVRARQAPGWNPSVCDCCHRAQDSTGAMAPGHRPPPGPPGVQASPGPPGEGAEGQSSETRLGKPRSRGSTAPLLLQTRRPLGQGPSANPSPGAAPGPPVSIGMPEFSNLANPRLPGTPFMHCSSQG